MLWLAGPVSGHPACRSQGGTSLLFLVATVKVVAGGGGGAGRGGVGGCLLLVALALYVVDLFQ